eukprot:2271146-Heterocapsa_arctica.AAC.1
MAMKYSDDIELLRVNNTETTVVAELVSALSVTHANSCPSAYKDLQDFLKICPELDENNLVGL